MSRQLITEYRSELDRIHAASGSKRESVVREAFKDLLKRWGKSRDLIFLAEHEYITPTGDRRYIDGALVHSIRVPFGYEKAKPFKFTRIDMPNPKRAKGSHPKPKLKSEPDKGLIVVDEDTQLTGIPREAWDYRLGNRSAIDWVLDQHKEKTPRDPTVRAKFNSYRFADYKESMIALLARVITVSLETVKITEAMRALERRSKEVA